MTRKNKQKDATQNVAQDTTSKTAASSVLKRKRELLKKRAKRRRRIIVAAISLIVIAAVGVGAYLYFNPLENGGRYHNPNADLGQLDGKTPEEIQEELNRVVDEGMFNISIAEVLSFPDGTSEGDVRIENVPGNRYLMDVSITLDETGEVVYESGIIEPNHHITKDRLKVDLDKGAYPATAMFTALDPETEAVIGQAGAQVTIRVEG